MRLRYLLVFAIGLAIPSAAMAQTAIEAYIYGQSAATQPYGSGLRIPAMPSASANAAQYIAANVLVTLSDTQTLTNKTLNCSNNTCTNVPTTALTGALQAAQFPALTGDITTTAGSLATTLASVNSNVGTFAVSTLNAKGLATAGSNLSGSCTSSGAVISCPLAGTNIQSWTQSGSTTRLAAGSGTFTNAHAAGFDASGNIVDIGSPGGAGLPSIVNGHIIANASGSTATASDTTLVVGKGLAFTASGNTLTINQTISLDTQSANSPFPIPSGDASATVLRNNTTTQTDTIAAATGAFGAGYGVDYFTGPSAGNTIAPTTSSIGGRATLALGPNQYAGLTSDGTNYRVLLGLPTPPAQNGLTCLIDSMSWGPCVQASGTNSFTGNNTHAGSETFNGNVIGRDIDAAGSLTLDSGAQCGGTINFSSSSPANATVNSGYPAHCSVTIIQQGTGAMSVVQGTGVVNSACTTAATNAQFAVITVKSEAAGTVVVWGGCT